MKLTEKKTGFSVVSERCPGESTGRFPVIFLPLVLFFLFLFQVYCCKGQCSVLHGLHFDKLTNKLEANHVQ